MPSPQAARRRFIHLAATLALLSLSGCGFRLRGAVELPFSTLAIELPESSELYALLRRHLESTGAVRVLPPNERAQAQVLLRFTADSSGKSVLSLNAAGQAREYRLQRSVRFRLHDQAGRDWLAPGSIQIVRDLSFNDQVLSKEAEEALLLRDMQQDLAQQLLRRLAAARPPAKVESGPDKPS